LREYRCAARQDLAHGGGLHRFACFIDRTFVSRHDRPELAMLVGAENGEAVARLIGFQKSEVMGVYPHLIF
jgi:hypothetical protein